MTDIDTAAIEARLASDPASPWHVCDDDATQVRDVFGRLVASAEGVDEADLIAHAPTDLRALLDEVERLQRWVARLRRWEAEASEVILGPQDLGKALDLPLGERMILCALCGNKRCPHATDHEFDCTGSNEPGQPGSRYPRLSNVADARTPQQRATDFLASIDDQEAE